MRFVALFTICFAAVAGVSTAVTGPSRIVGGSPSNITQYSSIAAILGNQGVNFYQSCGGTIINNRSILTAASCVPGAATRWRTRIGSTYANSGGSVLNTASIIIHPNYNARTFDNDIAILRLSSTISYNAQTQPASIASANYILGDNQVVWAAGWGATYTNGSFADQLRHVQIWTVNQNTCAQRYATVGTNITANMVCSGWLDVGGRGYCQGDFGGPLFHNNILVGVLSFSNGCAQPFFPGVNARVSRFTSWIQNNA